MSEKVTEAEAAKISRLSALAITAEELTHYTQEINSLLGYMAQLQRVDVSEVEPMSHVHGSSNVMRSDVTQAHLPIEASLGNAPDKVGRFIRVPIVIAEQE